MTTGTGIHVSKRKESLHELCKFCPKYLGSPVFLVIKGTGVKYPSRPRGGQVMFLRSVIVVRSLINVTYYFLGQSASKNLQ